MSKTKHQSFYDYVEASCQDWLDDQETGQSIEEIFLDMARAVIDSGEWREEGFTAQEVREFCRGYGLRFR